MTPRSFLNYLLFELKFKYLSKYLLVFIFYLLVYLDSSSHSSCLSVKGLIVYWWTSISLSRFFFLFFLFLSFLLWFWIWFRLWFRSFLFLLFFGFWLFLSLRTFLFCKAWLWLLWLFWISRWFNIIKDFFVLDRNFFDLIFHSPFCWLIAVGCPFCLILSQSCKPFISSSHNFFHFNQLFLRYNWCRLNLAWIFFTNLNRFLSQLLFSSRKSLIKNIILLLNNRIYFFLFFLSLLSFLT